ncbi:BMC domain-containing protein [Luedemannella helvata]|uniref:BMC domain-containing protein n=1 Tax=Luedemannella helvata TaxID=349315 RepID=A0ABP4VUT3_9ACTN
MDLWHAGALGMVETRGLTASVVAIDVMAKAAEVKVIGVRRSGGGLVAVSFIGDMASVRAAVESARRAVAAIGGTVSSTVIGRPAVPATFFRGPEPSAEGEPVAEAGGPSAEDEPAAAGAEPPATGAKPGRRTGRSTAPKRRPPASGPQPPLADPPADPPSDPTQGE